MSKISTVLIDASEVLANSGIAEPRREASSLLAFAIGRDRTFLFTHDDYELSDDEEIRFQEVVERRSRREPLQYIKGTQEFYGLDFRVTPDVLIPRPETELIVEESIGFLRTTEDARFCEVGAGSGCISVAILANCPNATAIAVDISPAALEIAAENARLNGVFDRLELIESDVFVNVADEKFDLIVSNPPYISAVDMYDLQPEVRDFEPHSALTDGADGLAIVKRVIDGAASRLKGGGELLVEIGFGQSEAVAALAETAVWTEVSFIEDLQKIPRTLRCRRRV